MDLEDIRKNLKMKKVLKFVEEFEKDPKNDNRKRLTKSQICKKIGISDSSLKRDMKDLNIKSFYRHDMMMFPLIKRNQKTIIKMILKGIKPIHKKHRETKSELIKGGKELTDEEINRKYGFGSIEN
jgi:hypothetical protein